MSQTFSVTSLVYENGTLAEDWGVVKEIQFFEERNSRCSSAFP